MPSPKQLTTAISFGSPRQQQSAFASRLRSAVTDASRLRSAVTDAAAEALVLDTGEEDPDSDEEADRILENFRARAEVVKKEQEAMQKAEEEAWRATAIQSFWGPALKAEAMRRARERLQAARDNALVAMRNAAAEALRGGSGRAQEVLQDQDFLLLLMEWREAEELGTHTVVTEERLRAFTSPAGVCKAFYRAIRSVSLRRCVL